MPTPTPEPTPQPTSEPKPAEDKKPATLLTEEDKPTEPAATPFDASKLTLPEGLTLSEADTAALTPLAEKYKLSNEAVSDLLAIYGDRVKQLAEGPMKAWNDLNTEWVNEVKKDATLGDGNSLKPEVKSAISKVKSQYGDAAFNDALNVTGAGNNPAVIRFLYKVAQVLTEGGHVGGRPAGAPNAPQGPSADAMYPGGPRTAPVLRAG